MEGSPGIGGFEEAVASTWEQGIGAEIMSRNKIRSPARTI